MAQMSFTRCVGSLIGLIAFLAPLATAQNSSPLTTNEQEMERVQAMVAIAKSEAGQFNKSGGKADDPKHPNLKWAATFWRYRLKHPGTPATKVATIQALSMLYRADRISEMQARAETLKLDEPAWEQVINVLLYASIKTKDYSYLISKAEALTQSAVDPKIKARARFNIGEAYWRKGDVGQARVAFQTVLAQYANTPDAEEAEGNLREIEFLNVGQPAPQFERTTINGDSLSLAVLKGKVVVLKFWGTY